MMYDNYIMKLASRFENRLNEISADYNFDLGDEFEIAICQTLRLFLPEKYGICRGFAVNIDGEKAGDDIIIYDKYKHVTINLHNEDYARKENVPIEAIYAYIEAKHTLTKESFDKAVNQVIAVKKLCSTRKKVGLYQYDPLIGEYKDQGNIVEALPKFRNPVIGIILGRFAVDEDNQRAEKPELIQEMAKNKLAQLKANENNPELIILGSSNAMFVGYRKENAQIPTLFYPDNGLDVGYQNLIVKNKAFGIFMAQLIAAIDWAKLGYMPWVDIINDAKYE